MRSAPSAAVLLRAHGLRVGPDGLVDRSSAFRLDDGSLRLIRVAMRARTWTATVITSALVAMGVHSAFSCTELVIGAAVADRSLSMRTSART